MPFLNLINFKGDNENIDKFKSFICSSEYSFDIRKLYPIYDIAYSDLNYTDGYMIESSVYYAIYYYMLNDALNNGYKKFDKYFDNLCKKYDIKEKFIKNRDIDDSNFVLLKSLIYRTKKFNDIKSIMDVIYKYFELLESLTAEDIYIYKGGIVTNSYLEEIKSKIVLDKDKTMYDFNIISEDKIDYIKNNMKPVSHDSILEFGGYYFKLLFNYGVIRLSDWVEIYLDLYSDHIISKWDDNNLYLITLYVPEKLIVKIKEMFPKIDISMISKDVDSNNKNIIITDVLSNGVVKSTRVSYDKKINSTFVEAIKAFNKL